MTHPLFRKDIFIETAFARRFQAMLRSAWRNRSWHVIVADPGAGKTMGSGVTGNLASWGTCTSTEPSGLILAFGEYRSPA